MQPSCELIFSMLIYTHMLYIDLVCSYVQLGLFQLQTQHQSPFQTSQPCVCVFMCQIPMINDPKPCSFQLPSFPVVSHTSSSVTIMDAGTWHIQQLLLGLIDVNRPCSICKYTHAFTFRAELGGFVFQWSRTTSNHVLHRPSQEVNFRQSVPPFSAVAEIFIWQFSCLMTFYGATKLLILKLEVSST